MTGNELRMIFDFEEGLKPGDSAVFRWTNNFNCYAAPVTVARVNRSSITGTLNQAYDGYPHGWKIKVPRITKLDRWSNNNRALPA